MLSVSDLHMHRFSAAIRFRVNADSLGCRARTRHTSLALYVLIRGVSLLIRCGNKPSAPAALRRCAPPCCPYAAHHHHHIDLRLSPRDPFVYVAVHEHYPVRYSCPVLPWLPADKEPCMPAATHDLLLKPCSCTSAADLAHPVVAVNILDAKVCGCFCHRPR